MPLARIYLPLTSADLTDLAEGRPVGPAPLAAHAVTPLLGRTGLVVDEEELEHAAWLAATREASGLTQGGSVRRVIAAADVDVALVLHPTDPDVPSRVTVAAPIERRRVVSFHIDEHAGDTEPTDLLWYDVTELADVRDLVDTP